MRYLRMSSTLWLVYIINITQVDRFVIVMCVFLASIYRYLMMMMADDDHDLKPIFSKVNKTTTTTTEKPD